MKPIDKKKLTEHLTTCIEISEGKSETKIAEVLRNLNGDVEEGLFDSDERESSNEFDNKDDYGISFVDPMRKKIENPIKELSSQQMRSSNSFKRKDRERDSTNMRG